MVQRIFFIAYLCKEIFLEISILSELTRVFPIALRKKRAKKNLSALILGFYSYLRKR